MGIDREELRKLNNQKLNEIKLRFNTTNEPEIYSRLPKIKKIAFDIIQGIVDYCESKDVYFFSEIPVSEEICDVVMTVMDDGIKIKCKIPDAEELKKKDLYYRIHRKKFAQLKQIVADYREICDSFSKFTFQKLYVASYLKYYTDLISAGSIEDLISDADEELAKRLGMEDDYKRVLAIILLSLSNIENGICKINVLMDDYDD